jgi:hypothetical protein
LAAAVDQVSRLDTFRQREQIVTGWTAHAVGKGRDPVAPCFSEPQRVARAIRALHQVARLDVWRQVDYLATIGAADSRHRQIPRSRWSRPRSKPTITSSSTVITGTAIRPVRAISSSRAAASSATFFAVNSIP